MKSNGGMWVQTVWPARLPKIIKFYGNPGVGDPLCPAASKFQRGVAGLGLADLSNAEFAFHGTPTLEAVRDICWNNLDPRRRKGQACGRGEYFSVDAITSAGHARNVGYIIVCIL